MMVQAEDSTIVFKVDSKLPERAPSGDCDGEFMSVVTLSEVEKYVVSARGWTGGTTTDSTSVTQIKSILVTHLVLSIQHSERRE